MTIIERKKNTSRNFKILESWSIRSFDTLKYAQNDINNYLCLAEVMTILTFFKRCCELLFRKFQNFEYESFWSVQNDTFYPKTPSLSLYICFRYLLNFRFLNVKILLKKFQNSKNGMHNFIPNQKRVSC
jgi:hypothetical protein